MYPITVIPKCRHPDCPLPSVKGYVEGVPGLRVTPASTVPPMIAGREAPRGWNIMLGPT